MLFNQEEHNDIQQYAADIVEFARNYHMDDRGYLPLHDIQDYDPAAKEILSKFEELSSIDGFIEKLNFAIKGAEANYKTNLAESVLSTTSKRFNASANPDLECAIKDFVIETTKDEVLEVQAGERGPLISVNSASMDLEIKKINAISSALEQDWTKSGIGYYTQAGERNEQLAAKALKAEVKLHHNGAMGG